MFIYGVESTSNLIFGCTCRAPPDKSASAVVAKNSHVVRGQFVNGEKAAAAML
jgi:hypothetical protein